MMMTPNDSHHKPPPHRKRSFQVWLKDGFVEIFLPVGFPSSVTDDFVRFRILDTLQNIASQAALLLANRAVLQGVGVGDPTSTATGAVLLTVVQDSTGRLATILFAWLASSSLGTEPQKYRLLADLFNDLALLSDCTIPRILPYRLPLLCFSGVSRALCGVIANGVGATMTAHFAKRGNLADVSAKSASQGTVAQLIGTMVGTFLLHRAITPRSTWSNLVILVFLHLFINYKCVKSVVLISINRQRASLIISDLFNENLDSRPLSEIPTPTEISKREYLFASAKTLGNSLHTADIGVSTNAVFNIMTGPHPERDGTLQSIFEGEQHILWPQRITKKKVHILIHLSSHSLKTHLRAWAHAYVLAQLISGTSFPNGKTDSQIMGKQAGDIAEALRIVDKAFEQGGGIELWLKSKGWDVERSMMCPHMEGRIDWSASKIEEDVPEKKDEKRIVDTEKRD